MSAWKVPTMKEKRFNRFYQEWSGFQVWFWTSWNDFVWLIRRFCCQGHTLLIKRFFTWQSLVWFFNVCCMCCNGMWCSSIGCICWMCCNGLYCMRFVCYECHVNCLGRFQKISWMTFTFQVGLLANAHLWQKFRRRHRNGFRMRAARWPGSGTRSRWSRLRVPSGQLAPPVC